MGFRLNLAVFLASIWLALPSGAQPVLVYCGNGIQLINSTNNRNTYITISTPDGNPPNGPLIPTGGNFLINSKGWTATSMNYPGLLTGIITNLPLYAGFDYAITNSAGDLGFGFFIPTNATSPWNIMSGITYGGTNLSGGLNAYSTHASDLIQAQNITNVVVASGGSASIANQTATLMISGGGGSASLTNVLYGATTNVTSLTQLATIYWRYTNGIPWYGRVLTNGQN